MLSRLQAAGVPEMVDCSVNPDLKTELNPDQNPDLNPDLTPDRYVEDNGKIYVLPDHNCILKRAELPDLP